MTNWFSSRSRWKTISPVSGHLIQRFGVTSRLLRRLRIFGRTTLLIQLIQDPSLCSDPGAANAGRKVSHECRNGPYRLVAAAAVGAERISDGPHHGGAYHDRIGG